MKLSKIALAVVVASGGASAFAAAPTTSELCTIAKAGANTTYNATLLVNNCSPAVTLYVAGSSAMKDAVTGAIYNARYFDTSKSLATVLDLGSKNGYLVPNAENVYTRSGGTPTAQPAAAVTAYFGMSNPLVTGGNSVPLLVVYNSNMGSASGVSQVLAGTKSLTIDDSNVVKVGPVGTASGTCFAYDVGSTVPSGVTVNGNTITQFPITYPSGASDATLTQGSSKVACTASANLVADVALSDVDPTELVALRKVAEGVSLAKFTRKPIGMQGFAVAVNNNFYNALQNAQSTSAGPLPTSCSSAGAYTELCQPSITRAQYASLVSQEGAVKSAAGFIPGDATVLTLARRDQLSGTQATSNMYFLNNSCNLLDAKSKINSHGGALTPLRAADTSYFSSSTLVVNENIQTAQVENDLAAASGYSIGVIALSKGASTDYKFVKLDGVSPNFAKGGSAPYSKLNLRTNMVDGTWPLQVVSYAVYGSTAATYDSKKSPKGLIISQLLGDLSTPTASITDLAGMTFFSGTGVEARISKVSRFKGNNCSPLQIRTGTGL